LDIAEGTYPAALFVPQGAAAATGRDDFPSSAADDDIPF
jgi:hypothetical protein